MRYLAFDIECCDGAHICEFGYVITDEDFNVKEQKDIIINPEHKFRLTGRPGGRDIYLSFTEEQYYSSPLFTEYYEEIKNLLERKDQVVIGHSVSSDAGFLKTACKKYNLPPINFSFFDSQKAYGEYANIKNSISLEKAESLLELPKPEHLHKSDEDALLTLQLVQAMCNRLEVTLPQLMELCPAACGSSENYMIRYKGNSLEEMLETVDKNPSALSNGKKERCIAKFAKSVRPQGEIIKSKLNGKNYCFGRRFEMNNVKLALLLIQLMKNHGSTYNTKVIENDLYIATDEEIIDGAQPNTRYAMAQQKRETQQNFEILTFDELYKLIGVTEEELLKSHVPIIKECTIKKEAEKTFSTGKLDNTIGALLRDKGIDIFSAE